jgi:hypothetical protein
LATGIAVSGFGAEKTQVGIFTGNRSAATEQIAQALTAEGFEVGFFKEPDVSGGKIYGYDALFFGGGWSQYEWLDLKARMHLVEYVEKRGGGVIFSMFRCGWAGRSGIRPSFPEIAQAYNKTNGPGILVTDRNHPITKSLPERFMTPYWDHAVMRLGPNGKTLAVDNNGEIALCCGELGKGRVVFIGQWIGINKDGNPSYPLPANDKTILLNSIRWMTDAPDRKIGGDNTISDEVKLKLLRREKILEWTHAERGISWNVGILTQAMYPIEEKLDDLVFRAKRLVEFAEDKATAEKLGQIQRQVTDLVARLQASYENARKEKIAQINGMSIQELEQDKATAKDTVWDGEFLPPGEITSIEREIIKIEGLLASKIRQSREAKFAAELAQDAKAVPQLITQLGAGDTKLREKAAIELGRIGDARSIEPLIKALKDDEYYVRRNVIFALGWIQAKEAVPALFDLAKETKDVRIKRRVVEALGLIGDTKAIGYLIESLKSPDHFVRQNAILSLGWLGDKAAIEPLVQILKGSTGENLTREDLACVIRSLGHIGNESAIRALQDVKTKYPEKPPGKEFYNTQLTIPEAVGLALAEIEGGGRRENGIRQEEFLKGRDNFYWLRGKYNAIYGRWVDYFSHPKDVYVMGGYAASSGGTGFIQWMTGDQIEARVPGGDKYLTYFSELGLKHNSCWRWRDGTVLDKAGFERDVVRWGKYPALGGFWAEEKLDWAAKLRDDKKFQEYLLSKYSSEQLAGFGIKDISAVKCPQGRNDAFLWTEYMEYLAATGVEMWEEMQDWLTALRKGTELTFSLSQRYEQGLSTYISAYPRINQVIGANGPQSYGEHSYVNNFNLDMHCDGEPRPALGEFYAYMAGTPARVERGFASSFVHGQCFFVWWWGHVFKHAPDANGYCLVFDKGRWEAACRQFSKGKALSDYLMPVESAKLVAQLYSGRTTTLSYGRGRADGINSGRKHRYTQNQEAIWESLLQSHLPVDMTWLETMTKEKLARYKVAILSDGKSLKKEELELIREWVKEGGILIATGGTTIHDQWDRPLTNYALSDVFGTDYVKTEIDAPEEAYRYVERDVKPDKGIETIELRDKDYLKHMGNAERAEYEKGTGFDVVKVTTGKVIGVWKDGTAAAVENAYGKGCCIFLAPIYPGLSHTTGGWTVDDLYKDFWPGSRELIAGCVRRALDLSKTELPVEVDDCSPRVELSLKKQDDRNRWMVHLLNCDPKIPLVKGVEVILNVPQNKKVKSIYYVHPAKEDVAYKADGTKLKFTMRDCEVHEMAVIEYEPEGK